MFNLAGPSVRQKNVRGILVAGAHLGVPRENPISDLHCRSVKKKPDGDDILPFRKTLGWRERGYMYIGRDEPKTVSSWLSRTNSL